MLGERSAVIDIQNLEAAADREDRQIAFDRRVYQSELYLVASVIRRIGLGFGCRAVTFGIHVRPTH
jgi:hypothetical protein